MTTRIAYLDALKGFAIVLMVFAHVIAWNLEDWHTIAKVTDSTPAYVLNTGFLWQLIYSFHMPLFFCVSGFLTFKEKLNVRGGGEYLLKRTKRLLIPYITTGFLLLALRGNYGYWFLFSLWQLSVVGILLNILLYRLNKTNSWLIDAIVIGTIWWLIGRVCSIGIINVYLSPFCDFGKCSHYALPFLFGYFMRKHTELVRFLESKFTLLLTAFVIMFAIRYFFPENGHLVMLKSIISKLSGYLLGICGSMVFWIWFSSTETSTRPFRLLSYLGKKTLQIYVLHLFFAIQIAQVGKFWYSSIFPTCMGTQIIYASVVTAFAITMSLMVDKFLRKSNLIHSLIFG